MFFCFVFCICNCYIVLSLTSRLSTTFSPWGTIALAHFYQYTTDNYKQARRVLAWAARQREIPTGNNNKFDKMSYDDDGEANNDDEEPETGNLQLLDCYYYY